MVKIGKLESISDIITLGIMTNSFVHVIYRLRAGKVKVRSYIDSPWFVRFRAFYLGSRIGRWS